MQHIILRTAELLCCWENAGEPGGGGGWKSASSAAPITSSFGFKGTLEVWDREDNGTPLQYSCLENPMDGGAW